MNSVSDSSQHVGEREEARCLSLCVVIEQYLGHRGFITAPAGPSEQETGDGDEA
jgi:hypothetical protein